MKGHRLVFLRLTLCVLVAAIAGCDKAKQNRATSQESSQSGVQTGSLGRTQLPDGKIAESAKHACVRSVEARVFRSQGAASQIGEETSKNIDAVIAQQAGKPVLWVRIDVNINELFALLRQQDPPIDSFDKGDFYGVAGTTRLAPAAPNGIVEVVDYTRYLQQDLIFPVSEDLKGLDVAIRGIPLVKYSFR